MNIVQEYSNQTIVATTSECDKVHNSLELYNHIVDEVYSRAIKGDQNCIDILRKVVSGGVSA